MANVSIREKLLSDGRVSLILDYRLNGQRIKQTLKIYVNPKDAKSRNFIQRNAYEEAYRSAELLKNQVEARLIKQEHDLPTAYDKRASFIEYFDHLAAPRNYNWQSVAKHIQRFAKGKLPFGNVTEEWLSRFQDYLRISIQDVTAYSYMGIITTALNQAVREKLIPANPMQNVRRVRGEEKDPKYLTKEQVQLLLENRQGIPDWFVEAFLFSCYTGLRLSDVESLEWGDLHPTGTSQDQAERLTIVKRQIKTKQEVKIPLSPQAHDIIKNILRAQEPGPIAESLVFALKSRTTSKRYIERWRKQAGIPFTYHSSRHTFGTGLQSAGVDINTTSKLMGHKSLGMTLRYAKVVDKSRNDAIDKMAAYWKG